MIDSETLLSLAVEHAMRISDDEAAVARLVDTGSDPARRMAALGNLLVPGTPRLEVGSPLLAWSNASPVDPHWRHHCPPLPNSLYAMLVGLRELCAGVVATPIAPDATAFDELWRLRDELERALDE